MRRITYAEKRFFEWHEDELSVTIREKGGSYGGGSEVLVVEHICFRPEQTRKIDRGGRCVHIGIEGIQIPTMCSNKNELSRRDGMS